MNGLSVREIADALGVSMPAVRQRIMIAGIQPTAKAGNVNFYNENVVELIRNVPGKGRPRKEKTGNP